MERLKLFTRGRNFVFGFLHKPWYPALIALLAMLDAFIVVVPTDLFLVSAVFVKPKRWLSIALMIAAGSVLGCLALAFVIDYDQEIIHRAFPSIFQAENWAYAEGLIEKYGFYAVLFGAVGPLPLQPFVVVGALSTKLPFAHLVLGVILGRCGKFILFAWFASRSPELLEKLKIASPSELRPLEKLTIEKDKNSL
jgi:membrane protein YqaA with SNARE-associated domain